MHTHTSMFAVVTPLGFCVLFVALSLVTRADHRYNHDGAAWCLPIQLMVCPFAPWLLSGMPPVDTDPAWHAASLPAVLILLGAASELAHRVMHSVPWLRRVHSTRASTSSCHPLEHAVCTLAPALLGPSLFRWSPPYTAALLAAVTLAPRSLLRPSQALFGLLDAT